MDDTLAARVQVLEDVEEIRRLKANYCKFSDRGFEGSETARFDRLADEVFSEDGVWDTGPGGVFTGRDQIAESFVEGFDIGVHMAINPLIDVDGDEANGEWHGLVPLRSLDVEAIWCCGKYYEKYRRTSAGWRISYSKFAAAFFAPHLDGWGRTRFIGGPAE